MFDCIETRDEWFEKWERIPDYLVFLLEDETKTLDDLCPGWEWVGLHTIIGRKEATGQSPDIVYELPNGIFVRGWDMTGAISRYV